VIRRVRFALANDAETFRFLQTLPRRGYSFVMPGEYVLSTVDSSASMVVATEPPSKIRGRRFHRCAARLGVYREGQAARVRPLPQRDVNEALGFATVGDPPFT
jgi:hypothetical protein